AGQFRAGGTACPTTPPQTTSSAAPGSFWWGRRFRLPCVFLGLAGSVALAQNPPTMFPPVRGTREMVGAANNVEVEAGFRMLTQGGNAVDAGVATVLAAAVSEQDHFGLGGEIPILIKMAGRPVIVISG